jgi:hypothetical protein
MSYVVLSPNWKVDFWQGVKDFRRTLSPEESELFNESIVYLCRNPQIDGVRKIRSRVGHPNISFLYRGDYFYLIYFPTQITKPFHGRRIEVIKAGRAEDIWGSKSKKV